VSWREAADDFEPDGSLRDIYVMNTTKEDWEKTYRFLLDTYPNRYSVDLKEAPAPPTAEAVFPVHHHASPLLQIFVKEVQVNCHFFTSDEIELDISPSDVTSEEAFLAIVYLMRKLGRLLNKRVVLTPENTPTVSILVTHRPTTKSPGHRPGTDSHDPFSYVAE
jgi:hypothetical protein